MGGFEQAYQDEAERDQWVAATEIAREDARTRVFRVSDELAASTLLDWSQPVQPRLEKNDDGVYDLVARNYEIPAAEASLEGSGS